MTIEQDLRAMSASLRNEFALVKRMAKEGRMDLATEELEFAKDMLDKYIAKLDKLHGAKVGIAGFIFRHTYQVPEEFLKLAIALDGEAKRLDQQFNKKNQQAENQTNRQNAKIKKAVESLKMGELVVLPTETVYGLFADATNEAAVQKIYSVKGRPTEKALNMNVASFEDILKYSQNQPVYLKKLVEKFLPGPLTIILEASKEVPEWIHIGKTTVGFRMPKIEVTQEVIKKIGVLVGPSANLTGSPSPRFFSDLTSEILSNAAIALKDDSIYGLDTTIIDLTGTSPQLLRQGAITREELLAALPELSEIK